MMRHQARPKRPMVTLTTFKSLEIGATLFDFDRPINEENFIINSSSLIYKTKIPNESHHKNVMVVNKENAMNGDMPDFGSEMIFGLEIRMEGQEVSYSLARPDKMDENRRLLPSQMSSLPFVCLNHHGRSNEVGSAKIKEGDVIKLGKNYIKVLQTHLSQQSTSNLSNGINPIQSDSMSSLQDSSQAKTCRICLMQDTQGLISPCKCKGSCQYVHLQCLKIWLESKVTRQQNRLVAAYFLSKFQCQLCKEQLPNKIIANGRELQFVELRKPDEPYLIVERMQQNSRDRTLFVLTPKDQGVSLGRGHNTDIRFNDLTVSRNHATIEFKDGEFLLSDLGSKFGTLLLQQEEKIFDRIMCFQVENKVYKFQVFPSVHRRAYSYL